MHYHVIFVRILDHLAISGLSTSSTRMDSRTRQKACQKGWQRPSRNKGQKSLQTSKKTWSSKRFRTVFSPVRPVSGPFSIVFATLFFIFQLIVVIATSFLSLFNSHCRCCHRNGVFIVIVVVDVAVVTIVFACYGDFRSYSLSGRIIGVFGTKQISALA